jgi:hyperosmotically inducible periplasmic protein
MKNRSFRWITIAAAAGTISAAGVTLRCHARPSASILMAQQADNTGTNKQHTTTADQQKNDAADRELAQKIRQSINSDKSLSTDGHNVKVIVRNGMVTLKGPVKSEEEKKNIEEKAADLAGADKVTNKLTVTVK